MADAERDAVRGRRTAGHGSGMGKIAFRGAEAGLYFLHGNEGSKLCNTDKEAGSQGENYAKFIHETLTFQPGKC